jgi:outer membrane protein OmpA-like peptidoglycan-associated protein
MKVWYEFQIFWLMLFLLTGCSANRDLKVAQPEPEAPQTKVEQVQVEARQPKEDVFILLPEPDGKVGAIRVTNAGGSQILDKSGDTTRVKDFNRPPSAPQPLDEKEIGGIFAEAIAAQPDLSPRFVSFTLWFESDKTKLTDPSKKALPEILRAVKIRQSREIHIVGHTDRVGTDLHNLKLSSRRANFVKDFFLSKGIKSSVLLVSALGESKPLVYTEDGVAEPINRRVEIMIR